LFEAIKASAGERRVLTVVLSVPLLLLSVASVAIAVVPVPRIRRPEISVISAIALVIVPPVPVPVLAVIGVVQFVALGESRRIDELEPTDIADPIANLVQLGFIEVVAVLPSVTEIAAPDLLALSAHIDAEVVFDHDRVRRRGRLGP
jgi:hypothetical protein